MRLIDADKLRKELLMMECMDDAIEIIDNEPTAYNVNKVVEELKTTREDYAGDFQDDVAYGLKLAIEIVKDGGS